MNDDHKKILQLAYVRVANLKIRIANMRRDMEINRAVGEALATELNDAERDEEAIRKILEKQPSA